MSLSYDDFVTQHVARIRESVLHQFGLSNMGDWICKHTRIHGENYSFKDHEFQDRIAAETAREVVVRKCSQVGISELSARIALATCAVVPNFTTLYTLPTAAFASTFMSTRIDPVIQSSDYLSELIHTTMDNAEVKRFGNSFLYMKGSQSTNAPISIPVDMLIHDELDYSSPEIISQYQSRLTHSKHKRKIKLSTPTVPKRGIDKEFAQSRRHFNFVKCHHCNHYFVPDYFDHVKVPGFNEDLRTITKRNLHLTRYHEARVHCPKCGGIPSLQPEHRQWVCENPDDNYVAAGFQVSPFDAPNIISAAYLVECSTQYKRYIDFINANLGLPAEDKESSLTTEELKRCMIDAIGQAFGGYVCGIDMGLTCWVTIGFRSLDGFLIVTKVLPVPLHKIRETYKELRREYRFRITVMDSQPYTETVLALQDDDPNLYGAVYVRSKNIETHMVRQRDEDKDEGEVEIRQVNINRDRTFDAVMLDIRSGLIHKVHDQYDEEWCEHLTDMKRVKEYTADAEMSFVWRKSEEGNDHMHHSLLYLWVASQMLGVSRNGVIVPMGVTTFPVKQEQPQ
jgi:hypothetical protein